VSTSSSGMPISAGGRMVMAGLPGLAMVPRLAQPGRKCNLAILTAKSQRIFCGRMEVREQGGDGIG
jgi:hypothetical protein